MLETFGFSCFCDTMISTSNVRHSETSGNRRKCTQVSVKKNLYWNERWWSGIHESYVFLGSSFHNFCYWHWVLFWCHGDKNVSINRAVWINNCRYQNQGQCHEGDTLLSSQLVVIVARQVVSVKCRRYWPVCWECCDAVLVLESFPSSPDAYVQSKS